MARTLRITVDADLYGLQDCQTLAELVAWVDGIREQIPAEHHEAARVEYDRGYCEESPTMRVWYERAETEPEMQKRERDAREAEARRNAEVYQRERALYEALKRKFEGT